MQPNWKHIVRARLAALRLPPARELEIVEEVALHLEAVYDDARRRFVRNRSTNPRGQQL